MAHAMREYYSKIYGLHAHEACAYVDPTLLTFFWAFAPNRSSFRVLWITAYCSKYHRNLLWGPIDDALLSTRLVQTYSGAENCRTDDPGDEDGYDDPCLASLAWGGRSNPAISFPGFFAQKFDYSRLSDAPMASVWRGGLADHTWAEVMRIDRIDLTSHGDTTTCTVGQLWLWLSPGSGIWYNVGRSKRALTTADAASLWSGLPTRPCTIARREGYDSVQLIEFDNGFSFEIMDCRGAELPNYDHSWDVGCPPPHIELRAGVPPRAERWAPALASLPIEAEGTTDCVCDASWSHINCEG